MHELPKHLQSVAEELLAAHPSVVPLDALGEATARATGRADEIEQIVGYLEENGRTIASPPTERSSAETLQIVLRAARGAQALTGRTPGAQELAAITGLEEREVRQALGFGRVHGK